MHLKTSAAVLPPLQAAQERNLARPHTNGSDQVSGSDHTPMVQTTHHWIRPHTNGSDHTPVVQTTHHWFRPHTNGSDHTPVVQTTHHWLGPHTSGSDHIHQWFRPHTSGSDHIHQWFRPHTSGSDHIHQWFRPHTSGSDHTPVVQTTHQWFKLHTTGSDHTPVVQTTYISGSDHTPVVQTTYISGSDHTPVVQTTYISGSDHIHQWLRPHTSGSDHTPVVQTTHQWFTPHINGSDHTPVVQTTHQWFRPHTPVVQTKHQWLTNSTAAWGTYSLLPTSLKRLRVYIGWTSLEEQNKICLPDRLNHEDRSWNQISLLGKHLDNDHSWWHPPIRLASSSWTFLNICLLARETPAAQTYWGFSDQNGISVLYIMLEIHHSGWEPLIYTYWGFPTRMVYLYYTSCLRYTILVGNPWYMPNYIHPYVTHTSQIVLLIMKCEN